MVVKKYNILFSLIASLCCVNSVFAKVCSSDEILDQLKTKEITQVESKELSAIEIAQVFDCNSNQIYKIYSNQLKINKDLSGKVFFTLVVLPDGSVNKIMSESISILDEEFLGKQKTLIKSFKFPSKTNSTTLRYSINFEPPKISSDQTTVRVTERTCENHVVMSATKPDGSKLKIKLPRSKVITSKNWAPKLGAPPLSFTEAYQIAKKWALNKLVKYDSIVIESISLKKYGCLVEKDKEYWYYIVEYYPAVGGEKVWDGLSWLSILSSGEIIESSIEK